MVNTADQYLKAIYLLQEVERGPVGTGAVAEELEVSPASANEMIGKLASRNLVNHEKYRGVELTDDGISSARKSLRTYCIIQRFLANVLEVEGFRVESRELESVIDDTVADRLDTIIDRESQCPDCFDFERDACRYLEAESAQEERQVSD